MRRSLLLFALLSSGCVTARRDAIALAHGPNVRGTAIAVAATGAALLLDDEIAEVAQRNDNRVLDRVETLGGGGSDKVMAGLFLYGLAARDTRARGAATDMFISSVVASRIITPVLKAAVHRTRPNGGDDDSFPSNHATQAFALASAVAIEYPRSRWIAYGLATGVSLARVSHNAHWTSDVVAGAAIGTFTGHTIARANSQARMKVSVAASHNRVMIGVHW